MKGLGAALIEGSLQLLTLLFAVLALLLRLRRESDASGGLEMQDLLMARRQGAPKGGKHMRMRGGRVFKVLDLTTHVNQARK